MTGRRAVLLLIRSPGIIPWAAVQLTASTWAYYRYVRPLSRTRREA